MTDGVTVRYWGGAKRVAGRAEETIVAATLGELRDVLAGRTGFAALCEAASWLVDGQVAADSTVLPPGATVDVLPPFAGGAEPHVRLEVLVSGRVQGVGFRYWVRSVAGDLSLRGRATNLPDGRVAVIAEGSRQACESLVAAIASDRAPGWVGNVVTTWSPAAGEPAGFRAG